MARGAWGLWLFAWAVVSVGWAAEVVDFDFTRKSWAGAAPAEAGFYLRDATRWNAVFQPLIPGTDAARGVSFSVSEEMRAGARLRHLTLADTTGKDRAFTLVYVQPLPKGEIVWHADPRSNVTVRAEMATLGNFHSMRDVGRRMLSRLPFVAASSQQEGQTVGRALGIDVARPAFFRAALDPALRLLYVAWDIGFAAGNDRAELGLVDYAFVPQEGFRGALEKYRALYPECFSSRLKRHGTLLSFVNASKIPNCDDFGFRFKEAIYEPDFDDAHGILSLHYEEPLQWWMKKPSGDTSLAAFVAEANRLADAGDVRAKAWRTSVFQGPDGQPLGKIQKMPWCDGIAWSLNTAPGLPGDSSDFNSRHAAPLFAARYPVPVDEYAVSEKGIDGEFYDSSEPHQAFPLDYCRERFKYLGAPLTFCSTNGAPAIFKGMIGFVCAREVSRRCRAIGRCLFANSTPNRWCWMPPFMDAMCREVSWVKKDGSWQPDDSELMLRRRMLAGSKPYILEMNCDFDLLSKERMEKFMNHCLAYGFFSTCFSAAAHAKKNKTRYFLRPELYERDRPLFKKYIPLMRQLSEAGWRPVNRLLPIDPSTGIYVEQFGDRYVTVFNPSQMEEREIAVPAAQELVTGETVNGRLVLPPETCRLLHLRD